MTPQPVNDADDIPQCDIHLHVHRTPGVPATVDGATRSGRWAYMCEDCFREHGVGLGIGRGSRLLTLTDPPALRVVR